MTFGSWLYSIERICFTTHEDGHYLLNGHLYSNNIEWFYFFLYYNCYYYIIFF